MATPQTFDEHSDKYDRATYALYGVLPSKKAIQSKEASQMFGFNVTVEGDHLPPSNTFNNPSQSINSNNGFDPFLYASSQQYREGVNRQQYQGEVDRAARRYAPDIPRPRPQPRDDELQEKVKHNQRPKF